MSQVTTHVLDTATGGPAPGVTVVLEQDIPGELPVERHEEIVDAMKKAATDNSD